MSNITNNQILEDIRNLLISSRNKLVQTVNSAMVQTYWNIGKIIVEDEQKGETRAEYGKKQLEIVSKTLTQEFGKGFDTRNLRNMRQFYLTFPKWNSVSSKLTWTHYRVLIRVENQSARDWYIKETIEQNWSVRALERQISKLYYERLLSSNNKILLIEEANENIKSLQTTDIKNYLRDPYIFDFLNLPNEALLEKNIEQSLINNLQKFLLELGRGFAFVERQQRLNVEEQDFYIDLVFYNFKLKCFLLIDLKLGKLTHQDVGQMDTYVRVYDKFYKSQDDNPTIGLILCSEDSKAVAKYSVLSESKQLFSSKYLPFLPTIEELERELENKRAFILDRTDNE